MYGFLANLVNSAGTAEAGQDYLSIGCPLSSGRHHLLARLAARLKPLAMFIFHEVEAHWESVSSCHECSVLSQVARLSEREQMQHAWPGGALRRAPRLPGRMQLVHLLGQV